MSDNNLSIVLSYYDAINNNNPNLAAKKLSDDVQIISPLATKTGKDDVVEALKNICSIVERVTIRTKFSSEDQVMLALDMHFPKLIGILRVASLLKLEQGLISCIEMFYDSQAIISKKDEIFSSEEANKKG